MLYNKTGLQPVLRPVEQVHYFGGGGERGCEVPLVPSNMELRLDEITRSL